MEEIAKARPVLRWAGGKRRLVPRLVKLLPARSGNYFEPMAGSAALFFYIAPRRAVVADTNPELMNFYRVLRNSPLPLTRRLAALHASRTLYYKMRERKPRSRLGRAVRFAYLNRLCWNGLHRVNREGDFNVPIGDRRPEKLWSSTDLLQAAKLLRNAKLLRADFESTMRRLKRGDFVFLDPPYPRGAREGSWFNRYCRDLFSLDDHRRLGKLATKLDKRGVLLMILVASEPEILRYYPRYFRRTELRSKSLISGKTSSRRTIGEVVLTNYVLVWPDQALPSGELFGPAQGQDCIVEKGKYVISVSNLTNRQTEFDFRLLIRDFDMRPETYKSTSTEIWVSTTTTTWYNTTYKRPLG